MADWSGTVGVSKELIGRAAERERLSAFLASPGHPPDALLLAAEPGMGKTTLWTLGLRAASEQGYQVLSCRPAGAETKLAYAGLADLVRGPCASALADLPPPQRHALEVALLVSDPDGAPPSEQAVAFAFLTLLETLSEDAPILLAVDDAQWLDAPTAAVLEYATRRLGGKQTKVLTALRSGGKGELPFLAGAARDERFEVLDLGPMAQAEIHELLLERQGFSLPRPALLSVYETSGGNPFFALELARTIADRSERGRWMPVPMSLDQILRERLSALPDASREPLLYAALLAEPTLVLLEKATKGNAEGLDGAVEAGIVQVEGARIRFAHPLYASAVYAAAPPAKRLQAHRLLADLVEEEEERARHLALGADGPDEAVARALEDAAEHAASRGAPRAATELAELSVGLTPSSNSTDVAKRKLAAGTYEWHAGDAARARETFEQLVQELPPGPLRADAFLHLAFTREDDDAAVAEFCRLALADAKGDAFRTSEIGRVLGFVSMVMGDLEGAIEHGRSALAAAEESADAHQLAGALSFQAIFLRYAGEGGDEELARALELEAELDHVLPIYSPTIVSGITLMCDGELDSARIPLEQARRTIDEQGNQVALASLLIHLCELEWRAGNWTLAGRYATEGRQLTEQLDLKQSQSSMHFCAGLVAGGLGDVIEARRATWDGARLATEANDFLYRVHNESVTGFVELSAADLHSARAVLIPLLEEVRAAGWKEPALFTSLWADSIETLVRLEELDEASDFLTSFEELVKLRPTAWGEGMVARSRGLFAAARGNLEQAVEWAISAAHAHEGLALPFERGRTLLTAGMIHRRAKQRRVARRALEEAQAIFERLGARLWAERASEELLRIGGRASPVDELTPTERSVAERAAAGETNKEIAKTLFMSAKTVEANLSRVYRKLGISSRAELRRGAVPPASTSDQT